jgi:hypothetical protein
LQTHLTQCTELLRQRGEQPRELDIAVVLKISGNPQPSSPHCEEFPLESLGIHSWQSSDQSRYLTHDAVVRLGGFCTSAQSRQPTAHC